MRSTDSPCCLTRVVNGDDHHLELVQLQAVMQRIQQALYGVPAAQRAYIGNALFNLAVKRILSDAGSQRAASLLMCLNDAVQAHNRSATAVPVSNWLQLHG